MIPILRGLMCACIMLVTIPIAALANADEDTEAVLRAAAFSKQIEQYLGDRGARVAIVFRNGRDRDRLPDGIRYTHGSFWVYQPLQSIDGTEAFEGYAVYNLYAGNETGEGNPRASYLMQDFPVDFTLPMYTMDAAVIIPTPEVQRRILEVMSSERYEDIHHASYSLLSNPHDPEFQNSNEFLLDVLAAGLWQTTDREQLKVNLAAYFEPTRVRLNVFERLFGPVFDRRVQFGDQSGSVVTTTFGSMAHFMEQNGYARDVTELVYDPDRPVDALEF
ncbi:DUF2145 domain-containing protein [Maricaulaceae bacterium EIL42A08]|nr:DUF2145 domain-containing protein [Maricaulaceae bacterium EIL42A08]